MLYSWIECIELPRREQKSLILLLQRFRMSQADRGNPPCTSRYGTDDTVI